MNEFLLKNRQTRCRMMVIAGVGWTVVLVLSLFWNWYYIGNSLMLLARSDAGSSYQKDLVYRRWASLHGGVYVPPTDKTPPNPYLKNIPDRDVVTTEGKLLTLINPAYMTRQVHELGREAYGLMGHMTSLYPIRPENVPDIWETQALRSFEAGETEAVSVATINNEPFLRLMHPFRTEASCLKCHGVQGYKEGDLQGGISISVPLKPHYDIAFKQRGVMTLAHAVAWIMGLVGLWAGNRMLRNQWHSLETHNEESTRMLNELDMQRAELQIQKDETNRLFQELSVHNTEIEMQNDELCRTQEELNDSRSRYFDLYDLAPVGYITVSVNGFILESNLTAAVLLGVARGALVKQPILRYIYKEDQGVYFFYSKTLYKPGGWQAFELRLVRADGQPFWAGMDATALQDKNGDTVCRIVLRDLTDRKAAETERIARQAAEEANRAKSLFLANMSHEIRTPMNAVLGFAHVLGSDASLSPKQTEYVGVILRSGEHLLRLINDILDMSRIDAGQTQFSLEDFRLIDLIQEVEVLFRESAAAKGLGFVLELDRRSLPDVHADLGKLRQILINLLGNAFKFTQTGQVILRVRSEAAQETADRQMQSIIFEVEDTGPGISKDYLKFVFDLFYQTADAIPSGGTGLGLSISRKYARLMGGDITVTSRVGTGSCFRFEVPLKMVHGTFPFNNVSKQVIGLSPGTGPWRILAVDDVSDNLILLTAMLRPVGFEVREASDGDEALKIFHDWLPHAVLLDMRMPVMDGYEAVRRIKATESGRGALVVAISAGAFHDSRKQALDAGADEYLSKPFLAMDLFKILGHGLGLHYVYAGETVQSASRVMSSVAEFRLLPTTVQAIRKAVAEGDMLQLMKWIDMADTEDPQAARRLRSMADSFDYRGIMEWLDSVQDQ
jgi:PAS domain S-box-containing protein